jgi:hypothetical protein
VRVGVLDDQAGDQFWRFHSDLEADRRSVIVQVDVPPPDLETLEQLGDRVAQRRERW